MFILCLFFGVEAIVRLRLPVDTDFMQDESESDGYNKADIEGVKQCLWN